MTALRLWCSRWTLSMLWEPRLGQTLLEWRTNFMPLSGNKKRGTFYRVLIDVGAQRPGKDGGKTVSRRAPSRIRMFFFGIVHHRSRARALAFMSDPPQRKKNIVFTLLSSTAKRSGNFAEVRCIFAYETRLIAVPTTQINVNRLRNIIARRGKKKSHYRTIEKSFI